jgi:hypothetical protein
MTDPQDALDLTLKLFKINASKLSEAAGLHKSVISRYRNKRQGLEADTFVEILRALPKDARDFYYNLITDNQSSESITFVMKENGGSYKISLPQCQAIPA